MTGFRRMKSIRQGEQEEVQRLASHHRASSQDSAMGSIQSRWRKGLVGLERCWVGMRECYEARDVTVQSIVDLAHILIHLTLPSPSPSPSLQQKWQPYVISSYLADQNQAMLLISICYLIIFPLWDQVYCLVGVISQGRHTHWILTRKIKNLHRMLV